MRERDRRMHEKHHTTQILMELQDGDTAAADRLLPLVYDELRALAGRYMQRERANHTLQPTALVHEAYLRLVNDDKIDWKGRSHFLAIAARSIRQILVNHAHAHRAAKRGGDAKRVTFLDPASREGDASEVDLLALEDALKELSQIDERRCRVVELRYFGGLTVEETAEVLEVSTAHRQR